MCLYRLKKGRKLESFAEKFYQLDCEPGLILGRTFWEHSQQNINSIRIFSKVMNNHLERVSFSLSFFIVLSFSLCLPFSNFSFSFSSFLSCLLGYQKIKLLIRASCPLRLCILSRHLFIFFIFFLSLFSSSFFLSLIFYIHILNRWKIMEENFSKENSMQLITKSSWLSLSSFCCHYPIISSFVVLF